MNCYGSLIILDCDNNQISDLNVTGYKLLKSIDCKSNRLKSLNMSGCKSLQKLECDNNQLSNLNLDGCQNLEILSCCNNQLKKLNLNSCIALREIQCVYNQLRDLNVNNCSKLEELICFKNQIRFLDLNSCPKLVELDCYSNQLTFASLLISFSLPRGEFNCIPQDDIKIGNKGEVLINEVIDLSREFDIGGAITEFTWYNSHGQIIKPATAVNGKFTFDQSFAGQKVSCQMRNAKFPYWDLYTTEVLIKSTSGLATIQTKPKSSEIESSTKYPIICPSELGPAPKNVPIEKIDINSDGLNDLIATYPWGGSALYINWGNGQYYRVIRTAGKIKVAEKKRSNWAPITIYINRVENYENRDWNEDCSTLIDGQLYRNEYFSLEHEADGNPSVEGESLIVFDGVSYKPPFHYCQNLGIYAPVYHFEYQKTSERQITKENLKGFYCELLRSKYAIRFNYDVYNIPWEKRLFNFESVYFTELNGDNLVDAVVNYYFDDGGRAGANCFAALLLNGGDDRFVYSGEVELGRFSTTLETQNISIDGKVYTAIVHKPVAFIQPGEQPKPNQLDRYQLYIYHPITKEFLHISAVPGNLKSTFEPLDKKQFEKIINPPVLKDK